MDPKDLTQQSNGGALTQPPNAQPNGNMRGSTRIPNAKIDMMGEGNMRMAGAGLGALARNEGGMAAYGAAAQEYGRMQDYNRQSELQAYELAEQRRIDIADRLAAQAASDQKLNPPADPAKLLAVQSGISELNGLIGALEKGDLTGPWDGTVMRWVDEVGASDLYTGTEKGSERAYWRQRLENFRVSEALKLVAQTKGAISDKEMNLFLKPIPSTAMTNEKTWLRHLKEMKEAATKLEAFIQNTGPAETFTFLD